MSLSLTVDEQMLKELGNRESASPQLSYFCLISDWPFILQLLGNLVFSVLSLPGLPGSSKRIQVISVLTVICQVFLMS